MPKPAKPPASRANDRRILLYFAEPSTRGALDRLASAAKLTRSQMVAKLVYDAETRAQLQRVDRAAKRLLTGVRR